jgi:hypothetical protein
MPSDYLITTSTHADRPNGTDLVNGSSSTPNVFMGCKAKIVPDDLNCDIAGVVRAFESANIADDNLPDGNCMLRARIGHAVLTECGILSRVACGSLLYRVGKHRTRDRLRFCLPDNTGGYYEGYACGHLWIEVNGDIVDFSSGHWVAEAQLLYETTSDPADRKLGPMEWTVVPPEFIWQSAHSLKSPWRPRGQPTVGQMWYGPWWSGCSPNFGVYDRLMEETAPLIEQFVADAGLRERVGALLDI